MLRGTTLMDHKDFDELVKLLEAGLHDVGLPHLTDTPVFIDRDPEAGGPRRLQPRDHLVALLSALERHLALTDRETYDRALEMINEEVEESSVRSACVVAPDGESDAVPLDDLPELRSVRHRLKELIREIGGEPEAGRRDGR